MTCTSCLAFQKTRTKSVLPLLGGRRKDSSDKLEKPARTPKEGDKTSSVSPPPAASAVPE